MTNDSEVCTTVEERPVFYSEIRWVPELCRSCAFLNGDRDRVEMCDLIKAEGREDDVFICVEYTPVSSEVDKEALLRELFRLAGIQNPPGI